MGQKYQFFFYAKIHYDIKIMFHEDILYIYYCKYIKTSFLISNTHSQDLNLDNFKDDFLNI